MPLLSWHNLIIDPKNSSGVIIVALIQGSSIYFMKVGSGKLEGFCRSIISPLFRLTLYTTPGVVVSKLTSNSLSNLSVIISRCSKPKKPHRNPSPSAEEDSAS